MHTHTAYGIRHIDILIIIVSSNNSKHDLHTYANNNNNNKDNHNNKFNYNINTVASEPPESKHRVGSPCSDPPPGGR